MPVTMPSDPLNLYDLGPAALDAALAPVVSPLFRVKQIRELMHVRGVDSFDAITNVPKELRAQLAERFTLTSPQVVELTEPANDGSRNVLSTLRDGRRIDCA